MFNSSVKLLAVCLCAAAPLLVQAAPHASIAAEVSADPGAASGTAIGPGKTGLPIGSVVAGPVHRDANGHIVATEQKSAPESCQATVPASLSPGAKPVDILLLGASINERWDKDVWQRHFGKDSMVNAAVGGWTTEDILGALSKDGLKVNPRLIILLAGSNDVAFGRPPGSAAQNVRAIIRKLCSLAPGSKVLLLAILPRGEKASDQLRARIKAENRYFAQIPDSKFIYYLDAGAVLLRSDGELSPDIAPDATHFTARGYELLATAMQPTVEKLLAQSH
jgi:lysophospholipase L1-like esterase